MRKLLIDNTLRSVRAVGTRRAGFTLAELVVAMGILVLMLSLAGQVFTLTIKSTGQAMALTDVMQELRAFEQSLREDLRYVYPGESVIVIQGNPVNAYWTQDGREADDDADPANGYPHAVDPERDDPQGHLFAPRADVLMFTTARPGTSFAHAPDGVSSNLQAVTYGHAELGEYVPRTADPNQYDLQLATGDSPFFPVEPGASNYPSTTGPGPVPAERWHLARRSVLLLPTDRPTTLPTLTPVLSTLDDARLLNGETDVATNFDYESLVLQPQPGAMAGDYISAYGNGKMFLPGIFGNVSQPYNQWRKPFARSRLDVTPPPLYAGRMGHYFLPGCASFKVEWALNPRSEFVAGRLDGADEVLWFDPGDEPDPANPTDRPDPLRRLQAKLDALKRIGGGQCGTYDDLCRNLDSLLSDRTPHLDKLPPYSLSDRFRMPGTDPDAWQPLSPDHRRPNLVAFTATRPVSGTDALVPDDMFPGALRITIDVFDRARRMDRPMRHVMVIPIGG